MPAIRRCRRPLLVALLLVVLAAVWSAAPARAQTGPITGAPQNQWTITPTGDPPDVPGSRSTLTYQVTPGGSIEDSVSIFNFGTTPLGFEIYATDGLDTPDGAYDLLRRDQPASDLGTWVKLAQDATILQPKTGITVPFTLTVPADAAPGEHAGGIVASLRTQQTDPTNGQQVVVDQRAGTPMYVRVMGDLKPALAVEDLKTTYQRSAGAFGGGDLEVSYSVRNTGNVRLGATQVAAVTAPFGYGLASQVPDEIPPLLPGFAVTRTLTFKGVAPDLRLTTSVRLTPVVPGGAAVDPPPTPVVKSVSIWAIPWTWIALVMIAAMAGALVVRRHRNRRSPTRPVPPTVATPQGLSP
jgi:hypothetical protein